MNDQESADWSSPNLSKPETFVVPVYDKEQHRDAIRKYLMCVRSMLNKDKYIELSVVDRRRKCRIAHMYSLMLTLRILGLYAISGSVYHVVYCIWDANI